jgi:chemotaxis signal transduction protein
MSFDEKNIQTQSHVTLRLGDRHYACDLMQVQEIVERPDLEPCLDGPEILIGMFADARGQVPVLDLLGRPPDVCPVRDMSLVILEIGDTPISLIVDELLDIIEFDPSAVCPVPPGANGAPGELLTGIIEVDQREYYLLDLDRILSACTGGEAVAGEGTSDQGSI